MMQDPIRLIDTVSSGGAGTFTSERPLLGRLYAIEWVDGNLSDNNTAILSVTGTNSGVDQVIHTQVAGEGDADGWYYPRVAVHDLSAVGLKYNDESDEPVQDYAVVNGYLELVIAAGGTSTTGGCIVYLID